MSNVVNVDIPIDVEAAELLADGHNREVIGRMVSRILRPRAGPSPLAEAIAEIKRDARAAGLTDAEIDAELVDHKAERAPRQSAE